MKSDKVYRVVVECHIQVRAKSEGQAKALAEVAVRQACEGHSLLFADSPLVFDPEIMRNGFLAGKPKRVANE